MSKFTFKMKDRMKLVAERTSPNTCSLTVSGKTDVVFSFSKKSAGEFVKCLADTLTFNTHGEYSFKKTTKGTAGRAVIEQPTVMEELYSLSFFASEGKKEKKVFHEIGISRKDIRKMLREMREVYGLEKANE